MTQPKRGTEQEGLHTSSLNNRAMLWRNIPVFKIICFIYFNKKSMKTSLLSYEGEKSDYHLSVKENNFLSVSRCLTFDHITANTHCKRHGCM